jgi:hypothetical protein
MLVWEGGAHCASFSTCYVLRLVDEGHEREQHDGQKKLCAQCDFREWQMNKWEHGHTLLRKNFSCGSAFIPMRAHIQKISAPHAKDAIPRKVGH